MKPQDEMLLRIEALVEHCKQQGWPVMVAVIHAPRRTRVRVSASEGEVSAMQTAISETVSEHVDHAGFDVLRVALPGEPQA